MDKTAPKLRSHLILSLPLAKAPQKRLLSDIFGEDSTAITVASDPLTTTSKSAAKEAAKRLKRNEAEAKRDSLMGKKEARQKAAVGSIIAIHLAKSADADKKIGGI